jgi:septal ring factor EnvC (AmiA/AmiB activator)
MIIVDHGKNYYTVYAHLEEAFKAKGDIVETGEVIATVGDTGSMTGTKLYFEVRHHGKPMNPLEWLKKG